MIPLDCGLDIERRDNYKGEKSKNTIEMG
jgi:hypothetical protein